MNLHIELRHLRYFIAVAEELHFGRAAQRLHVAQPALSQQIRQLERLMDVTLFTRTSRSVELTEAGRSFQPRARELMARLSSDLDEALRVSRGESGRIDLAFISSAASVLGSVLSRFTRQRPGVLVQLYEGFTNTVLDRLERGAADVGIVRDAEERDGITLSSILEEPFVAVVPADHALAGRRTLTAAKLASSPLILFPQAAGSRAYARNLQPFREAGIDPHISLRGSEWNTILNLVANGLGVTIAPASAAAPLPKGAIVIPLRGTAARTTIQIAYRTNDNNPLVRAFQALVTERRGGSDT